MIVSLTTVGYGYVVPHTAIGKVFSSILLIVGVFIFSAVTGAISTYFLDNVLKEGHSEIKDLKNKIDETEIELKKLMLIWKIMRKKIDELKNEINDLKEIIKKNS